MTVLEILLEVALPGIGARNRLQRNHTTRLITELATLPALAYTSPVWESTSIPEGPGTLLLRN